MRALTYHGSKDVRIENVPDPQLQHPQDLILRVTATAICGSDLHLYRGKVPGLETGDILGHEFMGVVEEVGADVSKVQAGDRVVIPFVIACGTCFFCDRKLFSACETTNDSTGMAMNKKSLRPPAALFGFTKAYGGMPGGQAEYVRVPMANTGPLKIPDALSDAQVLFLSDILPTGYQAVLNTEVGSGSIAATRRGGIVSVPGVYAGFIRGFLIGDAFDKGLSFRMGQTHVQQHMPQLLEHIGNGRLKPEAIISHQLPLEQAARGYQMFDKKQDDCRKVVLTPAAPAGARLATAVAP